MLLVTMPLMRVCVALAVLPLTVKLMLDTGKVKSALAAFWPGAAATTIKLSTVLDAMFEAVSWTVYELPIAATGTLSVATLAQDCVKSTRIVGKVASVAPAGPLRTCHRHVVGLPVLVLLSVMGPLTGLPENVTCVVPVAGVKLALIGFSPMTIVRCTVSVEVPSLTWS
jgi:hypothetical protein